MCSGAFFLARESAKVSFPACVCLGALFFADVCVLGALFLAHVCAGMSPVYDMCECLL